MPLEEDTAPDEAIDSLPLSTASSSHSLTSGPTNDFTKFKVGEKALYSSKLLSINSVLKFVTILDNQNCVRWSRIKKGRWLASCGDSSVVYLYEPIFNMEKKTVSLDNSISLTGHTMEVLQVEFSKNGRFMASCSLDNSIIIWIVEENPRKLRVLNSECGGHTNFVTGLAWDPAEKFLATQSMDNTLKLWRSDSWECERTIQGYFTSVG